MPSPGGTRTSLSATVAASFMPSWGLFSPGIPLAPAAPQPVRRLDFPVGVNTITTPRASEPFGFSQLRAFANVELVRLAIETRKDQVERHEWTVRPRADGFGRGRPHDADARVRAVTKLLRKPDGVTSFATWLRLLLEDLLTLDAPVIEVRRTRGGQVVAFDVVPGDTIKLLVDETGRRPLAPLPAYQQVIKGLPWADLTSDDLVYAPRNPRPHHLYGFGPVEQVVVTLNTVLRRQAAQLAHFTEGNVPRGIINAPEGWTADQLREYQDWFDGSLAGNTAERAKLVWVGAGAKYQAFKDSPIKDEFDEWLARVVMFAFSLPPTPFVRQMNRSTSDNDAASSEEQGLAPLLGWAKRLMDEIVQDRLGHPDLEFAWVTAREIDPRVQAEIDDRDLRNGSALIDEVRARRGLDPVPGGNVARIYTATGAITLEANDAAAEGQAAAAARPTREATPRTDRDGDPEEADGDAV